MTTCPIWGYCAAVGRADPGAVKTSVAAPSVAPSVGTAPRRAEAFVPGLVVALLGGLLAVGVHRALPVASTLLVAILLGVAVGAVLPAGTGRRGTLAPGLAVATRRVLRVGIALLGLQVAVGQVVGLGWPVLLVVVGVVAGGIGTTLALGARLGVPPARRLLFACGSSICGAAAVAAVAEARDAEEDDVAAAVTTVVVLGSAAMLAIPLAATLLLGLGDRAAGAWAGAGVHEVGQVAVAGGILGGAALQVAVVVKLARVLLLAPVLLVVSRRTPAAGTGPAGAPGTPAARRSAPVPLFVLAFGACIALRSTGLLPDVALVGAGLVQELALASAMVALGTAVDLGALRRTPRAEVLLGVAAAAVVALLALPAAYLVS
jgi:uncharacterized integral membrane protein (TIGR00698 family)